MTSKHTKKKSNDLDDRLAGLVGMAQNYKADGYSDVQAMEATIGAYERSEGRNIGYATLERLFQALEARGFSFPEEELEEATTRGGTKVKESAELTPGQLNSYAAREGHSDIHFLKTKRVGYRDDGAKDVYLTLSLDNNEEYIVGKMLFCYSSDGDPVLEIEPAPVLVTSDRSEAINEFNNYNTSRSRESRRTRESSEKITWSSFDTPESNALEEKYLPDQGDGDNMASQAVTAATKLIYKWFNDGDVYDNSYGLSGWANDISGSANWLAKHVPGARDILWRIQKTHSEEEYVSNILWPLFNLVYDSKLLSSLEKKPRVDNAYSCKGPFEFNYEDEDAYQEEDPESFGDYDQDYELDESTGRKVKLARSEAAREPVTHLRTRESTEGKYAAGGRALQDDYDDIIEDILSGWDVGDTPQDGMTLPTDALEQVEAALKAHDPSLGQTDVQDIIETYFEHSGALAGGPGDEATVGDIEDEAFELGMSGFPDEDVQHRLSQKHGLSRGEVRNILAYESKVSAKSSLRESTGGRYTLEYVQYSRGDVYRKVGSFTAPSDQEACKKAAMIQANYRPLKDLDAEARAELEEDVMLGFEEYPEQHSDPIEAWDAYITYNSEEFSVRLTAPDGRVLVDTGMDDFAEEEDFEDPSEDDPSEDPTTPEARYARDHPGISKLWSMPKEYLADEKDFEESTKASVDKLLREAAKPVGRDRLRDWYNYSFRECNNVTGKPKMKKSKKPAVASILREAVVDKDWSEFQSDMFNAISRVYRKFNMGKSSGEATADKQDLIKVLNWMDAHGFWDGPEAFAG